MRLSVRGWLILAGAVVGLLLLYLLVFPGALWVAQFDATHGGPPASPPPVDQVRGRLLQAVGGLLALIPLYYTARNYQLSLQAQLTERFTQAVQQLGSTEESVRVGGVHGLARIAHDSRRDYPGVIEVLTTFVRQQSRMSPPAGRLPTDVAAAFEVVLNRDRRRAPQPLQLHGAVLPGADLTGADLSGANLREVQLADAQLADANLTHTDLRNANLAGANLTGAEIAYADLSGADLSKSDLTDAALRSVQVEGALFVNAKLIRTVIEGTDMVGRRWLSQTIDQTTADEEHQRLQALQKAKLAPREHISLQVAPATVGPAKGVAHGPLSVPFAYGPDGQTLAIGCEDGGIVVCDTDSGRALRTLRGHAQKVYGVAYSPDGSVLASASDDGTIRLLDARTGQLRHILAGYDEWAWPLAFHPDGSLLAAGDHAGRLWIWDTERGLPLATREDADGHLQALEFHPDGELLVVGDTSGSVRLCAARTGETLHTLTERHNGGVTALAVFSTGAGDGYSLASGSGDGVIRLWSLHPRHNDALRKEIPAHSGSGVALGKAQPRPVLALAVNSDGTHIASGAADGVIKLWDSRTGALRSTLSEHSDAIRWLGFAPTGAEELCSASADGTVRTWDPRDGKPLEVFPATSAPVRAVAYCPTGQAQVATLGLDESVRLWSRDGGHELVTLTGHERRIYTLEFDADGSRLVAGTNTGEVWIWNVQQGKLLHRLTGGGVRFLNRVAFSPDGQTVAATGGTGIVYRWNAHSGRHVEQLIVDPTESFVWGLTFSPDGSTIATANDDDTVKLWQSTGGLRKVELLGHASRVRAVAFNPAGDLIATAADDRTARLWNPLTGLEIRRLSGHDDRVYVLAFSPDGTRLATASEDRTIRIWEVATGNLLLTIDDAHVSGLSAVSFDADGSVLASAGYDGRVRLWDTRTGQRLHDVRGHGRRTSSAVYSPDGDMLATTGEDGAIRIWNVHGAEHPVLWLTLLAFPQGWASVAPDGAYKFDGEVDGEFWYAIDLHRFEPGELDQVLPGMELLPEDEAYELGTGGVGGPSAQGRPLTDVPYG